MVAPPETMQRIARLTPLSDTIAMLAGVAHPVGPQRVPVASAGGLTLAADVTAPAGRPQTALALRDGWAVRSDDLIDAGPYAPVPLAPPPAWVEIGDPLPPGADAVAGADEIAVHEQWAEATSRVVPGEGVLPANADMAPGAMLWRAGTRLRRVDVAVLNVAGVAEVLVRAPSLVLISAGQPNALREAAVSFLSSAIAAEGAHVMSRTAATGQLDATLRSAEAEAVIVLGGSGSGRRDGSVHALARSGTVAVYGIAISPGETATLGAVDGRPVLVIPGRLDAAVAVWLTIGRALLARLRGGRVEDIGSAATLIHKVASPLGLAELVLVQRSAGGACQPLASGYLSLTALAQADGWMLVPPDSEGFPAGAVVTVSPLP